MKRTIASIVLGAYVAACSVFTPKTVDTMEEGARVACIIAHAFLPDEKAIAMACDLALAPETLAFVHTVVAEHKTAMSRAGHARCDGGAP